jgi:hypothetical protein
MSAQQAYPGGLSRAHETIAHLLDDQNATVESIDLLATAGRHEDALRAVEGQRARLYQVIDTVAHDVARARPRRRLSATGRGIAVFATMAAVAVSSLAVSVAVMREGFVPGAGDEPRDGKGLRRVADLSRAPAATDGDGTASVDGIASAGDERGTASARSARVSSLSVSDTDVSDESPSDQNLIERASRIKEDAGRGRTPGVEPPQSNMQPVPAIANLLTK